MKDKTALITGASRGIGRAIALKFASQGVNIVLNYLTTLPEGLSDEITAYGVKCLCVKADIGSFEESAGLVRIAKDEMGSLDILVNNAGVTRDGLLMRMNEEDFDTVIKTNLKGTFNMIRHTSAIMIKQKSGAIINMSSVVGVAGNAGQANYAASKAGIIGLTKSTAKELASRGITCNAIAPGFIQTDMTEVLTDTVKQRINETIPLRRFGTAEEVAELACYLAGSGYITGQVIHIDGGMAM